MIFSLLCIKFALYFCLKLWIDTNRVVDSNQVRSNEDNLRQELFAFKVHANKVFVSLSSRIFFFWLITLFHLGGCCFRK
jgi:hypothetical protein